MLSLSDFGLFLLSVPNEEFPRISKLLPRMAKSEIQKSWTGSSGTELLAQTVDFVRSVSYHFLRITGHPLEDAHILDFGCGYGRITRLMYYFAEEGRVHAVDPWDKSIEICHGDGLTVNFLVSDYLPSALPVSLANFNLIFAFSVFTHLSKRATLKCLDTLSNYLSPDGLLVITIRPIEYWNGDVNAIRLGQVDQQKANHAQRGFSFLPHDRSAVDGDVTYGDTSMTLDWLRVKCKKLKVVGVDISLSDPFQIYLFMQKELLKPDDS